MACIWFWRFYSIKLLRSICYQSCSSWDQFFWKGALSPRLLETFGCKSTNSYQKKIYSASIWTNNMKMIAPRIWISRKYMLQIWTKNAQLHGTMYFLPPLSVIWPNRWGRGRRVKTEDVQLSWQRWLETWITTSSSMQATNLIHRPSGEILPYFLPWTQGFMGARGFVRTLSGTSARTSSLLKLIKKSWR